MRIKLSAVVSSGTARSLIGLAVALSTAPAQAKINPCAATNVATLQACINSAAPLVAPLGQPVVTDTTVVSVAAGTYSGSQIRINNRKNLWIMGDTTLAEALRPRILYQDTVHKYTDTVSSYRTDTSAANIYCQNNGAIWIHQSANIKLQGLVVDGNSALNATKNRIYAYPASLGKGVTVEVRGNVGISVLMSRNVQLSYIAVTNTWYGISILSPNLGGAYSFPDPNDPMSEVVATLPTSQAGRYGNHLIERCRIHDNVTGLFFSRDWDLSTVVRNNLFWSNYLRHWADPRFKGTNYITNLEAIDAVPWFNYPGYTRKTDNMKWTTVGGAIYTTDVALTPYRIHNNTFYDNSTTFGAHYKAGTQHLFYNNLIGRPFQFFRDAVTLSGAYTQTERQTEMLQYFSEHQRSNRVVGQDGPPSAASQAQPISLWARDSGNLRLFRMRMIKTPNGNWPSGRTWSNDPNVADSLPMTWVPDSGAGTLKEQSDVGGVVKWIRTNMWAGTVPDVGDGQQGDWSPPYLPIGIRRFLNANSDSVFRDVSGFDVRWTLGLPIDTTSPASPTWLAPTATEKLRIQNGGWPSYEGSGTGSTSVGALSSAGAWAAPARRIVLRDTLIETIKDSIVKFNMNISGEGVSNDDIVSLKIYSAKFYNDVPVSDTIFNQGILPGMTKAVTRPGSILSRKSWPRQYDFKSPDWNRQLFRVDDSLTANKMSPNQTFIGRIANPAQWLADSNFYARAEVVLVAQLKDGTTLYSNPGVFMFSRPRFQFDVRVTDLNGNELPKDVDGISLLATARQPLKVVIRAKNIAKLPVPYNGYSNLQLGDAGLLHGGGDNLQMLVNGTYNPLHPNDIVKDRFAKNDSVIDTVRALEAVYEGVRVNGTLIYRAVFRGSNDSLLPYFLEGRSDPIKIVSGAIYQVTIDSVLYDSLKLATPDPVLKTLLNDSAGARRDTILSWKGDTSLNVSHADRGDYLKLVLQVRDRWGNPVLDSSSKDKGLYVRLSYLSPVGHYPSAIFDPNMLTIDSQGVARNAVQYSFDNKGRIVAHLSISTIALSGALGAVRAVLLDSTGKELGTSGSARNAGVPDTTWIRSQGSPISVQWTDLAGVRLQPFTGWVGAWIPVRLKMVKDRRGTVYTGPIGLSSVAPIAFYANSGDTTAVTNAQFAGDSLSQVVWIRASDSTTVGFLQAASDSSSDRVSPVKFLYPQVNRSTFFDRDCDGRPDSLVTWFNGPLSFRNANGALVGDSLDVRFPGHLLEKSASGAAQRTWIQDSVLSFGWTPGALGAADARANRITVANPLSGTAVTYVLASLIDRAKPVYLSATDYQYWTPTGGIDSIVVGFSESVDVSRFGLGDRAPFSIFRNGLAVPLQTARLTRPVVLVDSGVYAFVLSSAGALGKSGDSLVFVADSLHDLAGNPLSDCHLSRELKVNPPFRPLDGWVRDFNGDGNADSVYLAFQDSLGSLPDRIFVRWGTPAETLTILKADLIAAGISTSQSSFTMPTKGWIGQTVVLDGITIVGAPRTMGPADTAYYMGTTLYSHLVDRVPPVVIYSLLRPDTSTREKRMDTLQVYFSEPSQGCALGDNPAKCLSLRDRNTKQPISFSSDSYISNMVNLGNGARWTILIPQSSNPVNLLTEIRGTPASLGGALTDLQNNRAGDSARWIKVNMDVPPPDRGWMLDRDGDGRVDAVLLQYSPARRPMSGMPLPSFTFEWGTQAGSPVSLPADSTYQVDSLHWMAVLNRTGEFGATSYGPAALRNLGRQETPSGYRFPVTDSVGAVLLPPALLKTSSASPGSDTLIVRPSEPVTAPDGNVLLEFRRNGVAVGAANVSFKSATARGRDGTWLVILGADSKYRPNPGDEVRLSTSGSVRDLTASGNLPHPSHPWVPLVGGLRTPFQAAYYDQSKDGRIDQAVVEFAAPPVEGTRIRVANPSGDLSDYREYVVTKADSGTTRFVLDFAARPWGQDVTSWTAVDLGSVVPALGADTSIHGGIFQILDRVEPVAVKATLYLTSDTTFNDTLKVKYSEHVTLDLTRALFSFKRPGDSTGTVTDVDKVDFYIDSANFTIWYFLKPGKLTNPSDGDLLRLTNAVMDASGNRPGTEAKWVPVEANKREFLPRPTLSNPMVKPGYAPGTKIEVPDLELVIRPTPINGIGQWDIYDPLTGKTTGTGHSHTGKDPADYNAGGAGATVFYVTTNVPTKLTLYIYDLVGTFVTTKEVSITQAMLDRVTKSPIGMVDAGIRWHGEDSQGRIVGAGIYPTRLIAYREPSEKERAAGVVKGAMSNVLVKVGVNPYSKD